MRGLNLDQLQTLRHVIELGSFSAAAERQRLTQPAVSLQIRQLEKRLGVRLIERVGRKARPTAAGAELAVYAGRIDALASAAIESMAPHTSGAAGTVRLGTGATACIFLLPPILRDLRERLPALEITVSTGNTAEIVKSVEENAIDLGLVTLPAAGRMLDVTPVIDDECVVLAPASMQLPARVTAEALSRFPVLLFEPGGNTRRVVDGWFARSGVDLRPVMSLGSVEAIKELVGAGLGCAVLPGMAVRNLAGRRDFAVRPLTPKLSRKLALVIRRDKPLSRGIRELVKAIRKSASKTGAGDE